MKYKVYVDFTNEEIPRPFYVGKGTRRRILIKTRNKLHSAITLKYGCNRQILFETDDEELAFTKERELIEKYQTFMRDDGWGANFTLGGEGMSGHASPHCRGETHPMFGKRHKEESKRKNSESNKIAVAGDKNGMFGKHHSDETRKKISENQRGWKHSKESKDAISRSLKGRFKGRKLSESTKKKLSDARRGKAPWNKGKKLATLGSEIL